jgi:hypothetical protein
MASRNEELHRSILYSATALEMDIASDLAWNLQIVPGVGHSNAGVFLYSRMTSRLTPVPCHILGMTPYAIALIYGEICPTEAAHACEASTAENTLASASQLCAEG